MYLCWLSSNNTNTKGFAVVERTLTNKNIIVNLANQVKTLACEVDNLFDFIVHSLHKESY